MPRGDRTGPFGMGPRTGRSAGYCAGFGAPGYVNAGACFGFGRGRGFGRGPGFGRGRYMRPFSGWGANPVSNYRPDPGAEITYLINEAKVLKDQIALLEKRINELNAEEKSGE